MINVPDRTRDVTATYPVEPRTYAIAPPSLVTKQLSRHLVDTVLPELIRGRSSVAFTGEQEYAYLYPLYELASRVLVGDGKEKVPVDVNFVVDDFSKQALFYSITYRITQLASFKAQIESQTSRLIAESPIFKALSVGYTAKDPKEIPAFRDLFGLLQSKTEASKWATVKADLQKAVRKPPTDEEIGAMKTDLTAMVDKLIIHAGRGRGVALQPDEYPNRVMMIDTIFMAISAMYDRSSISVAHNLKDEDYSLDAYALAFAFAAYLNSTSSEAVYDSYAAPSYAAANPQMMMAKVGDRARNHAAFYGGAAYAGRAAAIKIYERYLVGLYDFFEPSLHPRLSVLNDARAELDHAQEALKMTTLSAATYHAEQAFDFIQTLTGSDILLPSIVRDLLPIPDVKIADDPIIPKNWDAVLLGSIKQAIVSAEVVSQVGALLSQQTTIFRYAVEQLNEALTAITMVSNEAAQSPNVLNLPNDLFTMKSVAPFTSSGIPYTSLEDAYPLPITVPRFQGIFGTNPWTLSGHAYVVTNLLALWRKLRYKGDHMTFPGGYNLPIKVTNVYTYAWNLLPFAYTRSHVQDAPIKDIYGILSSLPGTNRPEPTRVLEDLSYAIEMNNVAITDPSHYAYAVAGMFTVSRSASISGSIGKDDALPDNTQIDINMMTHAYRRQFAQSIKWEDPYTDNYDKKNIAQRRDGILAVRLVYGCPWPLMVDKQPKLSDDWYDPVKSGVMRFHLTRAGDHYYLFRMHRYYPMPKDAIRVPALLEGRAYIHTYLTPSLGLVEEAKPDRSVDSFYIDFWKARSSASKQDYNKMLDSDLWYDNEAFVPLGSLYPHLTFVITRPLEELISDDQLDQLCFTNIKRGLHSISNTVVVERALVTQPIVMIEAIDEIRQGSLGLPIESVKSVAAVEAPIKGSDAPPTPASSIENQVTNPDSALAGDGTAIVGDGNGPGPAADAIVGDDKNILVDPDDPSAAMGDVVPAKPKKAKKDAE